MKKYIILSLCFIFLSAIAQEKETIQNPEENVKTKLVLGCQPHYLSLLKKFAQKTSVSTDAEEIKLISCDNTKGIEDLNKGILDAYMTDEAAPKNKFQITELGIFPVYFTVNITNPVNEITAAQLSKLYSSDIRNWRGLEGRDSIINIYEMPSNSPESYLLNKLSSEKSGVNRRMSFNTERELAIMCASDKNALAGFNMINYKSAKVKFLKIDKTDPSIENIRSGKYKYVLNLAILTPKKNGKIISEFLNYIKSTDADEILRKSGFVTKNTPQSPAPAEQPTE